MSEDLLEPKLAEEIILDQDDKDEDVAPVQYDISSYGADYAVDGLVKRLIRGDIFIPTFQRDYVWNQAEASRLVESLLLGLPVPGIFLAKQNESNKLLIIDGQQRLKSLQFFYQGFFNPKEEQKSKRVFKLIKVQKRFEGLTYEGLEENDRIKLDDSIIHATIIKQESPENDNTSIYHVFERLNASGKKLAPQEIRTAIYHGKLNDTIEKLNDYNDWREMFGPKSARLKDQELILRFLAAFYHPEKYSKPMVEFLNKFNIKYKNAENTFLDDASKVFKRTISFLKNSIGKSAFRPEGVLNVSVFEAICVGIAKILNVKENIDIQKFKEIHNSLLKDERFLDTTSKGTSDDAVFKERHLIIDKYFAEL